MAYTQSNNPFGGPAKVGDTKDQDEAGGSNAGTYSESDGPFCGPSGGSPSGTYPMGKDGKKDIGRGRAALAYANKAPDPSGIRACVLRNFPQLKEGAARSKEKLEQIKSDMQETNAHETMGVKRYNQKIQRLNRKIARK